MYGQFCLILMKVGTDKISFRFSAVAELGAISRTAAI